MNECDRSVWTAMMVLFLVGALVCWWAEAAGNPIAFSSGTGNNGSAFAGFTANTPRS